MRITQIFQFTIGVLSCLTMMVASAQLQTTHPLLNKISKADGSFIEEQIFLEKLQSHAYVFVGEKHDNPEHHRLELMLIQARLQQGSQQKNSKVVFEMLDDSQDAALGRLKNGDSLEQMHSSLSWPAKGWDWASYGPSFQAALDKDALKSGNISKAFIGSIYKEGEKVMLGNSRFESVSQATPAIKAYLLDQIFASHCGMQSRETLTPMLLIQLAKDASMASAMAQTSSAMLIAGGEHVRTETAVPWHLKQKKKDADVMVLQLIEVKTGQHDVQSYISSAGKADYYWFTSATEAKDYCAGVKGKAAQ
ncbi:ChaN family lipoprotein [Undibacterium sp. Di24W]|uniref:ChaN family lipoprotein n=1 Tax=Undibacterium sp. Di24W TaxID=3413033 RepID=UPI003BEFF5F6